MRPEPSSSPLPAHRDILGIKLKQGKLLYSQHNEELIIRDYFQDARDGVFLDVGCAWPTKDSNTYFLESHLGWSGVGVDALPQYARSWRHHRPRSRFFNYAVSDRSGELLTFYRAKEMGQSSLTPPRSGRRSRRKGRRPAPPATVEIRVPTITLTKLLDDNHVARVDFVSMDIEGAELQALAGFDIDRFKPRLVCVEWYHAGRDKLQAYFVAHGYARIERYLSYDGANDYYAPKGSPEALAAEAGPRD